MCEDVEMESTPKTLGESSSQASSCCISDVRGQEQAQLTSGETCASATSGYDRHFFSLLRTGFPLQEEELLLYSLTVAAFPENGFNLKDKWLDKYQPIVTAIESVYHVHFNCYDIRNCFHRLTNNLVKGFGKVRWMYYKDNVIEVLNGFKLVLEDLLADSGVKQMSAKKEQACSIVSSCARMFNPVSLPSGCLPCRLCF